MNVDGKKIGRTEGVSYFPTTISVSYSYQGYAAGSCIPSPQKNVERDFLKKYWSRWKADHVGRWYALFSSNYLKTYDFI